MNRSLAFAELEERVEQLVNRYSQLRDENDALKREIGFLRQENQRLLTEQKDIESKVSRILHRVQVQDDTTQQTPSTEKNTNEGHEEEATDDYIADASRYEAPGP